MGDGNVIELNEINLEKKVVFLVDVEYVKGISKSVIVCGDNHEDLGKKLDLIESDKEVKCVREVSSRFFYKKLYY